MIYLTQFYPSNDLIEILIDLITIYAVKVILEFLHKKAVI